MSDNHDNLEGFLKRFTPSTPSDELMQRLGSALERAEWEDEFPPVSVRTSPAPSSVLTLVRDWAMPACAAASVAVAGLWLHMAGQRSTRITGADQGVSTDFVLSRSAPPADVRTTDMGLVQDNKGQTYRIVRWEWNERAPSGGKSAPRSLLMPVKLEQP